MYFPWVGLLEQIRLSDIFVHYDDVQYTRGFYNRVQVKTNDGTKWLTVPLRNQRRGQNIDEVEIDDRVDWRKQHRECLKREYAKAPYRDQMLSIVDQVFAKQFTRLAELSRESVRCLSEYFGLSGQTTFLCSSDLKIPGVSSQRLRDICCALNATVYITGHGARNYLNHQLFEESGIQVEYINYDMHPYSQLHGTFTPYVTSLDLVANCGRAGNSMICSNTLPWNRFINEPT
jgi:hypothetical protein